MEVLAVFRGGKWIEYIPRMILQSDPRITQPLRQKAASVFVTALQKGYSEERAHTLAEALVFKDLYTELKYESNLEKEVDSLKDRGETA